MWFQTLINMAIVTLLLSHLFNTSGWGKTRLTLDGLCYNWGFYFSCRQEQAFKTGGSRDFQAAITTLKSLSNWNQGTGTDRLNGNAVAADRIFAMLFCARAFILQQLVDLTPPFTDAKDVRRRWVLLQVLPPRIRLDDIFVVIFRSIRAGHGAVMMEYVRDTINNLQTRTELFPSNAFFATFDEAQDAAKCLTDSFPSTTEPLKSRSALHELYRFSLSANIFDGMIISGTGLSMEIVEAAVSSISAKEMEGSYHPRVFTDAGNFLQGESQEAYVRKHITLSDNLSDRRLLERIRHWFVGRYIFYLALFDLVAEA
jgi:hypothetical protein